MLVLAEDYASESAKAIPDVVTERCRYAVMNISSHSGYSAALNWPTAARGIDYGCGIGSLLSAIQSRGIAGAAGKKHINEQPQENWIARFERSGMAWAVKVFKTSWQTAGVDRWDADNALVFRKGGHVAAVPEKSP